MGLKLELCRAVSERSGKGSGADLPTIDVVENFDIVEILQEADVVVSALSRLQERLNTITRRQHCSCLSHHLPSLIY